MIAPISDYDNQAYFEPKHAKHYNITTPKPHLVLLPLPEDSNETSKQEHKHSASKKPSKMKIFWKNKIKPGWGKFKNKMQSIFKHKHKAKEEPVQETPADTIIPFEEQFDICQQLLLSDNPDQTATIQTLMQLLQQYPDQECEIITLLEEWIPKVIFRLDTLFDEEVKAQSLPKDFIALLDSIDVFFDKTSNLESFQSMYAHLEFNALTTRRQFIKYLGMFIQIKGVDFQKLQTIVDRLRARFRSHELQQWIQS